MALIRLLLLAVIAATALGRWRNPQTATDPLAIASRPSAATVPSTSAPSGEGRVAPLVMKSSGNIAASTREDDDSSDFPQLLRDYPLRSQVNGKRLPLAYNKLRKGEERRQMSEAKVVFLSDGRIVAGLGDTLYMLDSDKRVEWKHKCSWILWDFAVVESTGLVYGGAGDGVMFILDASTGRELYHRGQNGKANHTRVLPFGNDVCLVINSMEGYRSALDEWSLGKVDMIEPDFIVAWRGTEVLWSSEFPPDAELMVKGDKIYAVTKTDKSIYVREIPPKIQ